MKNANWQDFRVLFFFFLVRFTYTIMKPKTGKKEKKMKTNFKETFNRVRSNFAEGVEHSLKWNGSIVVAAVVGIVYGVQEKSVLTGMKEATKQYLLSAVLSGVLYAAVAEIDERKGN